MCLGIFAGIYLLFQKITPPDISKKNAITNVYITRDQNLMNMEVKYKPKKKQVKYDPTIYIQNTRTSKDSTTSIDRNGNIVRPIIQDNYYTRRNHYIDGEPVIRLI